MVKANIQIFNISQRFTLALADLRDFSSEQGIEGKRELEKRAALEVVRSVLGDASLEILYEESGKPYLKGNEEISISHAYDRIAVLFSTRAKNIGVDIEKVRDKIVKIKEKFLSPEELKELHDASLEKYTLYWAVKEAVYKAACIEGLAFAEEIAVEPFGGTEKSGTIKAAITKKGREKAFVLEYRILEDYVLVYTISEYYL